MKIKVCGMRDSQNIQAVAALQPDFMGFIFYPKSPRYAESLNSAVLNELPKTIKKIGVFVNESLKQVLTIAYQYNLHGVQLHGTEMGSICRELRETGLIVIKAFPVADASNLKVTKKYEGMCDYFLFDTKTDAYGGSGVKFDWRLLNEYKGDTPFLLSGGIDLDDVEAIRKIEHPKFAGVDLNSRFETVPGVKDVEKLNKFLKEIKAP